MKIGRRYFWMAFCFEELSTKIGRRYFWMAFCFEELSMKIGRRSIYTWLKWVKYKWYPLWGFLNCLLSWKFINKFFSKIFNNINHKSFYLTRLSQIKNDDHEVIIFELPPCVKEVSMKFLTKIDYFYLARLSQIKIMITK